MCEHDTNRGIIFCKEKIKFNQATCPIRPYIPNRPNQQGFSWAANDAKWTNGGAFTSIRPRSSDVIFDAVQDRVRRSEGPLVHLEKRPFDR